MSGEERKKKKKKVECAVIEVLPEPNKNDDVQELQMFFWKDVFAMKI